MSATITVDTTAITVHTPATPVLVSQPINNHAVNMKASGASTYTWKPDVDLFGKRDTIIDNLLNHIPVVTGSSVMASPTVTTTYTVIGYEKGIFSAIVDSEMIVVTRVSAPSFSVTDINNATIADSTEHAACGVTYPVIVTSSDPTLYYWVSLTEGVYRT